MSSFLIVLHTFEAPQFLDRFLESIDRCVDVREFPVLLIDDSVDEELKRKNREVCVRYGNLAITYIDQSVWDQIRSQKLHPLLSKEGECLRLLDSFNLGDTTWNVHNTRNIGLILAKLLFSDTAYSINFDQDIVLKPVFSVNGLENTVLSCAQIEGCPDFSRLEWIGFYLGYLGKSMGANSWRITNDYARLLLDQLPINVLTEILRRYTKFPIAENCGELGTLSFPDREEYYGAAYILSSTAIHKCMFSEWYDNDWQYFKTLREPEKTVKFLDAVVSHQPDAKEIISAKWLEFEELGKILNEIYYVIRAVGALPTDAYRKIIDVRKTIILRDIASAKELLQSGLLDPNVRDSTKNISASLEALLSYVSGLEKDSLIDMVMQFLEKSRVWTRLIDSIYPFPGPALD